MGKNPNSGSESDNGAGSGDQFHSQSIVVPANLIATTADGFENKDHSWFANSQIPTDLIIQVEDITFYVHKYPLVARCGYLSRVELQPPNPNVGYDLKIENFPGGSETFEIVLKFCYGLPIGLNPNNVAALRCASELLEMTEDLEDGNLISKTEAFFTFVVLSSWRDSIIVLNSCQTLSPWAENLQIVRRCCDSISWKVGQENPATGEDDISEEDWWFEDVTTLRIDHFTRIIVALKAKRMTPEIIGSCIMQYAEKWLPSIDLGKEGIRQQGYRQNGLQWSITSGKSQEGVVGQSKEHRMIIESLVSALPPQKEAVSCKFLLWMLKMAIVFSTSQALISELEKRVGMVLEKANVNDLLIPTYTVGDHGKPANMTNEHTMHDIDVIQRILEYFLMYEQQQQQQQNPGTMTVSKLLDNYLAEIAKDPNLSLTQFQVLAESLPRNARTCHDGLYRAIDTYLKSHTSLSDHDRRRLCKIMNSEKLSLDACTHAAQNDRLPLRTIIQVLFSEQVKMRAIIRGKDQTTSDDSQEEEGSWLCTKKEVNSLKTELESVKAKMAELQTDYLELQQEYGKLSTKQRRLSSWKLKWIKIRKSSIFQGKLNEEETGEGQHISHSNQTAKFRRRMSIS